MSFQCYYCGEKIEEGTKRCPHCGTDLTAYLEIQHSADYYYNDGLEKAFVHDLSGAIRSLREALRCDKYKTDARNLLGLCLFARGDMVDALSEWVISKNLQMENNRADVYLEEIQRPGEIGKINSNITKFNQALRYCNDGSLDLAKLQLRRIIQQNSNMVDAYQLLALIQMQDKEYMEAKSTLQKAQKIDVRNTLTLRYQKELHQILKDLEKDNSKKKKKQKAKVISFQDGNDSITVPRHPLRNIIDGSWYTLVNIAIGLGLGLLVCFFLVLPTVKQQAKNDAANSLVNANEKVTNSSNSVSQLQAQVSSLNKELEKYTGKSDAVTSYEQLIQANNAVASNDLETAATLIQSVNRDLLSTNGQAVYDSVNAAVNAQQLQATYEAANKAYDSGDYATAITNYTQVTGMNESYRDGEALYRLAQAYEKNNQSTEAITSYNRISELFPDTSLARRAARKAQKLTDALAKAAEQ